MQTILGSGGAIAVELAKKLPQYTDEIRLVSRNPQKVNPGDELLAADVLDKEALKKAVKGSKIVYSVVGFPYKADTWQKSWPVYVENLIEACIEHNAKLVFFDNIYMYDKSYINGMDESTPINPPSKKGKIRAKIAQDILDSVQAGKLEALIARCADFYGPNIAQTSMLTETVFKPLSEGKKANWMGRSDKKHSFTFTPDAGLATAILGNSPEAYGQVWHLPTADNPPTGKEWVEMISNEMGIKGKIQVAPKWLVRIMGLFIPIMREMPEMMYQYENDYVFNSSKFNSAYDFKPTAYRDGVKEVVSRDY